MRAGSIHVAAWPWRGAHRSLLVVLLLVLASSAMAERYRALVIGNNDYQYLPRLVTAVSDAAATAELLKSKYGFDVTLLLNGTRTDLLGAMNRLQNELTEDDRLLIYYAGHGILDRVTGTGYWLPVDAKEDDDTHWVPNARISNYMQRIAARHVMVVADSCYSGTLVRSAPIRERPLSDRDAWLARLAEKRSRTALVSGGLEPVVDGGSEGHSVFASAFLKSLRDNDEVMEGQTLFREVRRQVVLNADQTPEYSDMRKAGHEGGDFLFVPVGPRRPESATPAPAADRELVFWQTIADSRDPLDFKDYIRLYPQGDFVGLARRRIRALEGGGVALRQPARPPARPKPPDAVPKPGGEPPQPAMTASVTPARPAIPAPSRGPWRLVIDVSGFNDGHLGRIEQTIEIEDGHSSPAFETAA